MSKRLAVIQSSYIPWKGYFDIIASVDEFILYDDVQYSKGSWRNRNKIKFPPSGTKWLTIPVQTHGKLHQSIKDTKVTGNDWCQGHWESLRQAYRKAEYFKVYEDGVKECFARAEKLSFLSEINFVFLEYLCRMLGISTKISWSMDYTLRGDRVERLIHLCKDTGSDCYLSGPSAGAYIDESAFRSAGVRLEYMSYDGYPEYPQLHGSFSHQVSVLDLLFHLGPQTFKYMKHLPSPARLIA